MTQHPFAIEKLSCKCSISKIALYFVPNEFEVFYLCLLC